MEGTHIILILMGIALVGEAYLTARLQARTKKLLDSVARLADAAAAHRRMLDTAKELLGKNLEHFEAIDELLEGLAQAGCEAETERAETEKRLAALEEEFESAIKDKLEADTEKARAEARSEEAWVQGVNSIIGYGGDIPRLSVEGAYGGK